MKTFLAIYTGSAAAMDSWKTLPERERKQREIEGVQAWHAWVERNRAAIVDPGGPLGRTKRVSQAGVADIRNDMGAYTVVQAESHAEAARLFENHPHYTIFPGDAVEVMECLPTPGN
jgi:hypothetical protein